MSSHYFFLVGSSAHMASSPPSLPPINTSSRSLFLIPSSPSPFPLQFIAPSLRPPPPKDIDMERSSSQCNKHIKGRRGGGHVQRRRREVARRHVTLRRKVRELQRLVPGGRDAPADQLLIRTADYIQQLRLRIILLRTVSELCVA